MAFSDRHDVPAHLNAQGSDRLDTWKEVAAHLRRSVRTVQRWEREEALPVHRHHHDKLGSIYASKAELDAWWVTYGAMVDGSDGLPPVDPGQPSRASLDPPPGKQRRRTPYKAMLGLAGACCALVIVAITFLAGGGPEPTLPPHVSHRLLLTEFENLTGEPALVGRLRDALQEQLGARRFANVVPADQIADLLRLMKKPPDTRVDAAIGRELCLRDGAIDAFVAGTLERSGPNYIATLRIVTPADTIVAASFAAQGATPAQLLAAVRRQVGGIQRALDERLTHDQRRAEVAKVTTSSLRALQLYDQAVGLMDQVPMKPEPAFALLTEALKLDPDFASAHILAAWALRNAGRSKEAFLPPAERAFALVDATTDAERYFILGSYYQLKLDVEKAVSAWEALLRLNPRHYWALGNLGRLYRTMGRHEAASELRSRQVEIRPQQFWGSYGLAEALFLKGDLEGARRHAVSAANLASRFDSDELQSRRSWLEILPACEAWLADDVARSARMARELEATLAQRHGPDRQALTASLGYLYLALGQRLAAERMFHRLPETEGPYHLAVVASYHGEPETANRHFADLTGAVDPAALMLGLPTLDARAAPLATTLVAGWEKTVEEPDAKLLRGQLALMTGDTAKAKVLLASSIDLREDRLGAPALAASDGLARAWKSSGDWHQAILVLEDASQNRFRSCLWPIASAHRWLALRAELAQLYRHVGREREAVTIEAHLRTLFKAADDDHPLAVRLRAAGNLPNVAPGRNN
jgi:tetratricopeptide (TPR) repeat protein